MIALIYNVFSGDMWYADRDNGSKAKDLTIKLDLITFKAKWNGRGPVNGERWDSPP
jgi:fructose-1,6-bisphosphatase/inositol monophosphatase family enzyme